MVRRLCPRRLGSLVQANARRLSLLLSLLLLILCTAINSGKLDLELSSWIHQTTRVQAELQTIETAIGDGAGSNSLLILQTPKKLSLSDNRKGKPATITLSNTKASEADILSNNDNSVDILSVESMMIHLEAIAIATHVTIDLFDVTWSLKDICLAPTPPDYEGLLVNQMLDHLMPCVIKTPLDCFWEGAKLLGPEQEVRFSSIGPKLKWTNLDPTFMIEAQQRAHPHASFPYQTLLNWMRRVGINDGYLRRPCLDPSDQNCPTSAPNKLSGEPPNIGHELTGGCHGLATKQMHWKEEELVGGIVKNKSGYITEAEALQSTVLLMGERDIYDYWRKTSKVQDINNWSIDKAKLVLNIWQEKFKEELAQFMRSSITTNPFKIHALTPKAMLEPIDNSRLLDLTNFKIAAIFMTIFACSVFPNFEKSSKKTTQDDETDTEKSSTNVDRFKITMLAITISIIVILTFIASLGLSSFINLPFNMATTQILPPLALLYGFRQALLIANTYSDLHRKQTDSMSELTVECLGNILPIIVIECATFIIPLVVATAFPVQATRVFSLQAIAYLLLSTATAILFIPSILTIFLSKFCCNYTDELVGIEYRGSTDGRTVIGITPPGVISITSKRKTPSKDSRPRSQPSIEEQIFSRLQDDLKNIKSDPRGATDINFSARLGPEGLRTSFSLSTSRANQTSSRQSESSSYAQQGNQAPSEPQNNLPDFILRPVAPTKGVNSEEFNDLEKKDKITETDDDSSIDDDVDDDVELCLLQKFYLAFAANRWIPTLILLLKLSLIFVLLSQSQRVKFGLQIRDIMLRGTDEYETITLREKFFPVFNVFTITKSGLDFPSNQKLLYEFYERIRNVDAILKDDKDVEPKFWLILFRNWLLELQEEFDRERNRSAISKEGWNDDTSDAAKLAYKLLAQTGRIDNPIDKNLVDTNRLVDKNGIINRKAFYYYLTAWVMNDAFSYSNSEADFRPEPKLWNENANDLRIERARPPTYSQIPFMMKLPEDQDNVKSVLEIRAISERFEQLDLPNFPSGIPFIFWDQFINLDYLFYTAVVMITAVMFLLVGFTLSNFTIAAAILIATMSILFEVFSLHGCLSIQFNSIVAVMLLSMSGIIVVQTIDIMVHFEYSEGKLAERVCTSIGRSFRTVIISLFLLAATTLVFMNSKMDFMTKYSYALAYLIPASAFNTLLMTPALLALFGSDREISDSEEPKSPRHSPIRSPSRTLKKSSDHQQKSGSSRQGRGKRGYPRVQSEISLSTISEESQTEAIAHDLKLNFSIRC